MVAISKDDIKARLAYSTISQLSYIVLGAAIATSVAVQGAALHIVMHAAGKITLFFCAGAIYVQTHLTKISDLDGQGREMPWVFGAFFVGALSIIGIPPLGGSWSKFMLMVGAADAGYVSVFFSGFRAVVAAECVLPSRACFTGIFPRKTEISGCNNASISCFSTGSYRANLYRFVLLCWIF